MCKKSKTILTGPDLEKSFLLQKMAESTSPHLPPVKKYLMVHPFGRNYLISTLGMLRDTALDIIKLTQTANEIHPVSR